MNSRPLLLLGHGGFGKEVAAWVAARNLPVEIAGFLDDTHAGKEVLGSIKDHVPSPSNSYLTCFGTGKARMDIRLGMEKQGANFVSLIFPDALLATDLAHSRNSIFLGACSISSNVAAGNDLLIQGFAVIGHDVVMGDGCTIGSHAFVGGGARLGPCCTIHPHAVILPNVEVGEGAVVGAGSVVIKNVEPHTTVFGSPARMISRAQPDD